MGVTTSTANAGATYSPIATQTLGSAAASVTFSSIPSGYTDLKLVYQGTMSSPEWVAFRFNSDSGSNYSMTRLTGDGSSAASARVTNYTYLPVAGGDLTTQTMVQANIQNYANSATYKTVIARSDNASSVTAAYVALWRSTSAITSIQVLTTTAATFATGSTFTLYGIKSA